MSGSKKPVFLSILLIMVMILSISQNINSVSDSAFAPTGEKRMFPKPLTCVADARKIPNCVESVKNFHFKNVTKECCIVLLGIPEDCIGILFPRRFVYRIMLKTTCKLLGITLQENSGILREKIVGMSSE
ncbi:uncharacterized protein LOC106448405 [Brassica napus]|nr:uncharacterized protein LOC106448405 [Brassica napus]